MKIKYVNIIVGVDMISRYDIHINDQLKMTSTEVKI